MYRDELDAKHLFYICRFTPGGDIDEDYRRHIEGMRAAVAAGKEAPSEVTIMIIQDPGYPPPDAKVRQLVAEMTKPSSFQALTAIVTTNMLIRGVLTALNWLRPKHYVEELWPDAATGLAWLERRRGKALPHLRGAAGRLGVLAERNPVCESP